ncbi:MAG: fibronectin type III-like domain-contianing protein [Clostridia bacterium]|nr:fibronectin type III-like domain-contianing protein [Clostridia bacterium]
MKIFSKKSVWVLITVYVAIILTIAILGGAILDSYKKVINASLGLTGFRTETVSTGNEDLEYFKSDYVKKDANGNVEYVTDADGYKHQVYDDVALKNAGLEKSKQVQKEGTTILWNSATNGLPLVKGNGVSLFSHSSVDWVYSGFGSGAANLTDATNMKQALTNAGLSVNGTLWDFYETGAAKDYKRSDARKINEVPWSKYTSEVKGSFASFNDAAIIVLSRRTGEGTSTGDATTTLADTPSGHYYDLSSQERTMINEVINLKKSGTFKKVMVLLNTPTDIWFDYLLDNKQYIDTCMWVGETGFYGLNEVGNILVGDSIPSGHLVDTFLQNSLSNPTSVNSIVSGYTNAASMNLPDVNRQGVYLVYAEGIYVGYKYYETRYEDAVLNQGNATSKAGAVNSVDNWKYSEEVAFPFGYGGAYTTFEYSNYNVEETADGNYKVTLTVTNTGSKNGADAVQVYVQKPYTEYDKQYGVEQAAVNLAGYAKTKELEPGASENVEIIVRHDAFKTYDSNNKKTYIREKGDYYIVAGQDAHDAVNNILAAKEKTPANTNGVMDAEGNANLVKKINFTSDDFTTYSVSELTNEPITNQFDDVDWNKYSNKTEANVTYLSRKDWNGTYPTEVTKLSLNQAMVEDLSWNKEVVANPEDVMPLYEQSNVVNLIDLKGLDYDHSAWDTLLDQLSVDEQIEFLASSFRGTPAIPSIAKPPEKTNDGPLGVRAQYATDAQAGVTVSFPSTVLLAASYNDKLAYEVGELMAEDMLHAGITGIYAPGANIHRNTISGRNYEYYSEDAYITGIMCKQQVMGIQSKGCYVNIKHIALNDQESYRAGVCTWANEQSIREIYLPAFEYVVKEGNCTGLMSAFNRIGTKWTGAHKGLLTEVLRDEWDFKGFVISDCAWIAYMGVVDGLMAGNDCILDTIMDDAVAVEQYNKARTNPTIAKAMRESVHRVLYVIANSNAMNGISSNTKIYEVKEWWQNLVLGVQIGVGAVFALCVLVTVLCFVFHNKIQAKAYAKEAIVEERKEQKKAAVHEKYGATYDDSIIGDIKYFYCVGQPWHVERILKTVVSCMLAAVIAATAIIVPIRLAKNAPAKPNTGDGGGGNNGASSTLKEQLGSDLNGYRFEAESSKITTEHTGTIVGKEGKTSSETNNPSGDMYVYDLINAGTTKFIFDVTSEEKKDAVLSICLGGGAEEVNLAQLFTIKVNGEECNYDSNIKFEANSALKGYNWTEKEVAIISLKKGGNVIELNKVESDKALNFDYIQLYTQSSLVQFTKEVGVGHTYNDWVESVEPTINTAGSAYSYCATCRHCTTESIPAISEANGWTKTVLSSSAPFSKTQYTLVKGNTTFTRVEYIDENNPTHVLKEYQFEAEDALIETPVVSMRPRVITEKELNKDPSKPYVETNASGEAFFGQVNGQTWTLTLEISASEDCTALMVLRASHSRFQNYNFSDCKTLTVNGENVVIPEITVEKMPSAPDSNYNWEEFAIVSINLKQGKNVIVYEQIDPDGDKTNGPNFNNIDYVKFVGVAELDWYEAPSYVFEAEKANLGTTGNPKIYTEVFSGASGDSYLGNLIGRDWTLTWEIEASQDCEATLIFSVSRYNWGNWNVYEGKTLTVNGTDVTIPNVIIPKLEGADNSNYNWEEYVIVTINLQQGKNVIALSQKAVSSKPADGPRFGNLDYIKLACDSELKWWEEE